MNTGGSTHSDRRTVTILAIVVALVIAVFALWPDYGAPSGPTASRRPDVPDPNPMLLSAPSGLEGLPKPERQAANDSRDDATAPAGTDGETKWIRSLEGESPVGELDVEVTLRSGDVLKIRTDTEGAVTLPRAPIASIRSLSSKWGLATLRPDELRDLPYIPAVPMLQIELRVVCAVAPTRSLRPRVEFLIPPTLGTDPFVNVLENPLWLRRAFERTDRPAVRARISTTELLLASFSMPDIADGFVGMRADGWQPAVLAIAELPPPGESGAIQATLHLEPAPRLDLILRNEEGEPITPDKLLLVLVTEGHKDDVDLVLPLAEGCAIAWVRHKTSDIATMWTQHRVQIRKDGAASARVPLTHQSAVVFAWAPGYAPRRVDLGRVTSDQRVDIRFKRPATRRRVAVRLHGGRIPDVPLSVLDVTDRAQFGVRLTTDSSSSLPAELFENGRWYLVSPAPGRDLGHEGGYVKWDGRTEIQLDLLQPDFPIVR